MTVESVTSEAVAEDAILEEAALSQAETNAGLARATGVLALGNVASRVFGLAREVVLTNLFGPSAAVDAFNVATIVPKALYDLLIGGHVNSALIPVLSAVASREGLNALWQLVSVLLSLVTAILALLVVTLEAFAPQVIRLVGDFKQPSTFALATDLLRLTAPALLFLSLFAVLSGTLYALRSFTWPALAGAVFNGSIVVVTVLLAPAQGIRAAATGWLVGSLVQLLLQLPGLRTARLRLTVQWNHPAIRQIARLYAPVTLSLIIDALVIRFLSYNLASQTGEGSISYMNWATTLIQFPQGLVATAISIAILPTLSRQAAQINGEGIQAFKDTLGLGLRLATTLILPATVGLFVLAMPIIGLIFEHGEFVHEDTIITARALQLYLFGLPFAALDLLLVYAFYARQDTMTPALVGLVSLGVYSVVAVGLMPRFGLFSLMIADSVKHMVHATVSAYLLSRHMGGMGRQRVFLTLGKTTLAALGMGVVAALALPDLTAWIGADRLLRELLLVGVSGGLSVAVFLGLAALLRIEEVRWLGELVAQRLRSLV